MDLQEHYEEIIKNKVSDKERAWLRYILDSAFKCANKIYADHLELATTVGFGIRADVIRAMIAYIAKKGAGKMGFECKYPSNTIRNCSYVLLEKKGLKIIFALTEYEMDIGKNNIYRDNILRPLMGNLFEPDSYLEDNITGLLVTYGKSKSEFCDYVRIGIPGEKCWVASIPLEQEVFAFDDVHNDNNEEDLVAFEEKFLYEIKEACNDEKRIG